MGRSADWLARRHHWVLPLPALPPRRTKTSKAAPLAVPLDKASQKAPGRLVKPTTSRTGADRRFGVSRFDVSNRPGSTFAAKYRPTARWRRFSTCTNLEMRLEIESFLRIARGGRAGGRPDNR